MAKIVLVGCGIWGRKILSALVELQQEIVVVETSEAAVAMLAADFGISAVSRVDNCSAADGFVVATPASSHAEIVRSLLSYGKPIFVEKPLTTDLQSAQDLARLGSSQVFVMHVWRYHAGVIALAQIAASGELGGVNVLRTERKNWTSPRKDVDSTWTLVPHDLSIAKAILGHIPEPVFACAELLDGRAVGMLAIMGKGAPFAIFDTSNRYKDKRREIRLHCERGVAWLPDETSSQVFIQREGESQPSFRPFDFVPPLRVELETFIRHLDGGPPPPTSIGEGVEVVEAVLRLRKLAGLND